MEQLDRITRNPEVMGGKRCIRGMRVTVGMIVGQIGAGRGIDDVLDDFPYSSARTFYRPYDTPRGGAEESEVAPASG